MRKFAGDSTLSEIVPKSGLSLLQDAVDSISQWTMDNFQLNPTKCKELVVSIKKLPPRYYQVGVNDQLFERV